MPFEEFSLSVQCNAALQCPAEPYTCSVLSSIEQIVVSLGGDFTYIEGSCDEAFGPADG